MNQKYFFTLALIFTFASQTSTASSTAHDASRMTGWEAFSQIQNGNMRFYEGKLKHSSQDPATRETLSAGQKPHTIVLSCSDSRVPPEVIFDQGLGDVFVVRLAGNVATTEAIASMEYAIEHLGAKLLMILGHESCGAVGAAVGMKPGKSSGSDSLDVLVGSIHKHLTPSSISAAGADKTMRQAVKENVSAVMKDLLQRSDIVREAVAKKHLILGQGIYSLKTGRVEFWDVGAKYGLEEHSGPSVGAQHVEATEIKAEEMKSKKKVNPVASEAHQ